jgi:predicted signal transduction protein with EAL and GGDEF domain
VGLLGRFTLLSLAATLVLGLALGDLLEGQIRARAIRAAGESAQLVARFGLQPQISYTELEKGLDPFTIPQLDYQFLSGYQSDSLVQVKVINQHRRIVYSNVHALIGKTATRRAGLAVALSGRTTARVVRAIDGRDAGRELIDTYAPFRFAPTGAPDGAFEVYTPHAPVAADIAHDTHRLYLMLAVGLVLFYTALFPIMVGASRRLRRQATENHRQARQDQLTGLPNRRQFYERIQTMLTGGSSRVAGAVMVMDLDRFKEVNDTLGHHSGDLLLKAAAARIRRAVRDGDVVARLGGDEFAVLLPGASHQAGHERRAANPRCA